MTGNLIHPDELVDAVDTVLSCRSVIPSLTLTPTVPSPHPNGDPGSGRLGSVDELVKAGQRLRD
jgi:hypothetical protein